MVINCSKLSLENVDKGVHPMLVLYRLVNAMPVDARATQRAKATGTPFSITELSISGIGLVIISTLSSGMQLPIRALISTKPPLNTPYKTNFVLIMSSHDCCGLFCCGHIISGPEVSRDIYLPIFFRLALLALGQAFACPCASEVSLNNRVQSPKFRPQQKHDITRIACTIRMCDTLLFTQGTPGCYSVPRPK